MAQPQPGWYHAQGDPIGSQRYWDGTQWVGEPNLQAGMGGDLGSPGQASREYGGVGERLVARIIDGIIVSIPIFIGVFTTSDLSDLQSGDIFPWSLIAIAWGAAYEIGFIGARGATPGKSLLGMKVIHADTGESPPGFSVAAIRWALALVGLIPGGLGTLASLGIAVGSGVMINQDPQNRSVYDRVATTLVVKS